MIDHEKFNEYFRHFDNETIIEVIDIFLDEYESRISALRKSIDEKDFPSIKFNAHSFKSVISNYFSGETFELIKQIEMKGQNEDLEDLEDLFIGFTEKSKKLGQELEEIKNTYAVLQ